MATDTLAPTPAATSVEQGRRPVVETTPRPAGRAAATPAVPEDLVGAVFASRSVAEHYVRGVLGLVLVVAALVGAGTTPWALLLAVPGIVAWRGCPTCWALGLTATLARRESRCVDGSCRRG